MAFTPAHLITVAVIAVVITALVAGARLRPGPWTVPVARALAILIAANEASWWVWLSAHGVYSPSYALPLQLCDLAAIVSVLALWFRTPILVELTYFWGLAGTANGLITPDVSDPFPTFGFIQYFTAHGSIVAAALFLVVGLKIYPRPWAPFRVLGLTLVVLVVDAFANLLTNGNYLYLRHTPGVRSLLSVMGPWPWYIVGAGVIALGLFLLLDLPFRVGRLRSLAGATERP